MLSKFYLVFTFLKRFGKINNMNKLLVLSGVPGSGKSYFSNTLKKVCGSHVYIISSDALRTLITGNQQDLSCDNFMWDMFYDLGKVYSKDKNGIVILDATHFSRKKRIENVLPLKNLFDEVDLVVFDIDRQIVNNQNLQREWPIAPDILNKYFDIFELPNDEDKQLFNKIIIIKNNDIAEAISTVRQEDNESTYIKEEL